MRAHEYRHVVTFEDTNLTGSVYYANHVRWQGLCRESFLREHAPEVIELLAADLALVTTRCSCDYFEELEVFDEVCIRLTLGGVAQTRIRLRFDYVRLRGEQEELVAQGEQEIACMSRADGPLRATAVPRVLRDALRPFEAAPDGGPKT